jgi:hypothetical protein
MSANHARAVSDAPSPQGDSDYDIILAALTETPRGRAFLQEHAHRNRNADTTMLLAAIARIEGMLTSGSLEPARSSPAVDNLPSSAAAPPVQQDFAAALVEIESDPPSRTMQVETVAIAVGEIEVTKIEAAPVEAAASEAYSFDVAVHVAPIEFLGPVLPVAEPTPVKPEPMAARRKPETRDPFADIRALSDIEKTALFT